MKKTALFTIMACSIAALLLIGILGYGLVTDGFGIFGTSNEYAQDMGNNKYEYTWDAEDITGLDIDWVSGKIDLEVAGESDTIRITEYSNKVLEEKERLKLSASGGTLKIKWNDEVFSFSLFNNKSKNLVIQVPKQVAEQLKKLDCSTTSGDLNVGAFHAGEIKIESVSGKINMPTLSGEKVKVSSVSGSIDMGNLTCKELNTSTTSGEIKATGIQAEVADIDSTSGEIDLTGSIEDVSASTISGAITVRSTVCPDKADFNSVSGSVKLQIPGDKGFTASYSSVSGSFSTDFAVTGESGKSGTAIYNKGGASFDFSTTSGSMKITELSNRK